MSTQTNPYQTPAIAPVVLADASTSVEPIDFQGSMTLEEGQQADQLMNAQSIGGRLIALMATRPARRRNR